MATHMHESLAHPSELWSGEGWSDQEQVGQLAGVVQEGAGAGGGRGEVDGVRTKLGAL